MPIVEVKVIPLGTVVPSISSYVRDCYQIAEGDPNVVTEITPTATVIEGELPHALELAHQMHRIPFARGVDRVLTTITIDERTDQAGHDLDGMIQAVFDAE